MSSTLKHTGEDNLYNYFEDYFQNIKIRIMVRKLDGEILFNADDVAVACGYKNHQEMIKSSEGQSLMKLYANQLTKGGIA